MPVQIVQDGRALNAYLSGDIDHHTAPPIRESIDRALIEYRPQTLRISFSGVSFMDSSGVGLVMGRYKQAAAVNCEVEVLDLNASALRIMKMSGLERLVRFRKTPVSENREKEGYHGKNQ